MRSELANTRARNAIHLINKATKVIARVSLDETYFIRALKDIFRLFATDRTLLEARGSLIVRKLCVLLDSRHIYLKFAEILDATNMGTLRSGAVAARAALAAGHGAPAEAGAGKTMVRQHAIECGALRRMYARRPEWKIVFRR